jgi:hypothetical protein
MATSNTVFGREGVENATNRKYAERDQQKWLSTPRSGLPSRPRRDQRDDELGCYHARRHKHHRASAMTLGQHLAQERQHRRVRKMEHHGTDEEEHEWAILEEHPDAFHFAAFLAVLCATGELVVNLGGSYQKQDKNRGDRESHDEEEDAPVGNQVAEEAHRHGGSHVAAELNV